MITALLREGLRLRGNRPAVLCHIGEGAAAHLTRLPLEEHDKVADLDSVRLEQDIRLFDKEEQETAAGLVAVVAASLTDLRRAVTSSSRLPRAEQVAVVIAAGSRHQEPPLPTAPGLGQWRDLHDLRVRRLDDSTGGWACELRFLEPAEVSRVLDAVASGTRGRHRPPAAVPLPALHGPDAGLWRPGAPETSGVKAAGPVPTRRVTPIADLVLRTRDSALPQWEQPRVPALDRPGLDGLSWGRLAGPGGIARIREDAPGELGPSHVPPIDEMVVNPIGFTTECGGEVADLTVRDGRPVIAGPRRVHARLSSAGTVTDVDLVRLRNLRGVRVGWSGHSGPLAAVRAVAGLAAGGVPLIADRVPPWAHALGAGVIGLLTSVREADLGDRLLREEHSVRLRREALRTHGVLARWRSLGTAAGLPPAPEPGVSVLLCTRRPQMVDFALRQVARQRRVEYDVVLTLHGFGADLPEVDSAIAAFREATGRELTVHEADGDQVFGSVLNDAVARAGGTAIAKWDDDDWYGPEHLADLLLARTYAGADLVGCAQEFVYLEEIDRTVWRGGETELATRFVAGGSLLMDRGALEDVGGFRPLPRAIDTQLLLAVDNAGGRIYRTHGLGYMMRRRARGHTWAEDLGYFLRGGLRQWPGRRTSALMEHEWTWEGDRGGDHR
ncbi:MAG: glycosyl transferase family 2 [Nocardiopsaceae bacterium]|nr:glycosyl transferase family 2 [Nocardiopsaceae bacterium]